MRGKGHPLPSPEPLVKGAAVFICGIFRGSLPDLRIFRGFSRPFAIVRTHLQTRPDPRKMLEMQGFSALFGYRLRPPFNP
jgi:hypothetical protein